MPRFLRPRSRTKTRHVTRLAALSEATRTSRTEPDSEARTRELPAGLPARRVELGGLHRYPWRRLAVLRTRLRFIQIRRRAVHHCQSRTCARTTALSTATTWRERSPLPCGGGSMTQTRTIHRPTPMAVRCPAINTASCNTDNCLQDCVDRLV